MANINEKKVIKKIVLIVISVLVVILLIAVIVNYIKDKSFKEKVKNTEYSSYEDFKTPKEYIVYRGGTFISQVDSKEENIQTDIYLKFNRNLDENETFYNDIVSIVANTLNYTNFRLIDSDQKLVVTVYCTNNQVRKVLYNGEEKYFEKLKSKNTLDSYEYNEGIDMNIQSTMLNKLIENDWMYSKVNFGNRTSVNGKYDIYENEGYRVRNIAKKVFNIVFIPGYNENIINGVKVGMTRDQIIEKLGEPDFDNYDLIGYKGKEIYAFFTDTSASIYRIEKSEDGYDDFLKLIEKFREDRNVKELTKNLTDIWSDYNVYEYDSNYVDIQYALRGVAIQFNVTSEHGLIVYKNYIGEINEGVNLQTFKDSQATVPAYTYIKADEDLVFNTEIQRCFAFEEIVS